MSRYTIRRSTPDERKSLGYTMPAARAGAPAVSANKYVLVDADKPEVLCLAFMMPVGANSKPEALFWAQRWISNNGGELILPSDFAGVSPRLP